MANKLELIKDLEPFILIPVSSSLADALTAFSSADATLAVVVDIEHLQSLMRVEDLANLEAEASQPLSELLDKLPTLIVIDGRLGTLDVEDMRQLASILHQTKANGLVVCQDNHIMGVIPRTTVARALPLAELLLTHEKRLAGTVHVPSRVFICRKCSPPQPLSMPRQGYEAPICPRNWIHGSMEAV